MSKAKNKPKPSYETCLIVNFGLHFLTIPDADPSREALFSSYSRAYPVTGDLINSNGQNLNQYFNTIKMEGTEDDPRLCCDKVFWLKQKGQLVLKPSFYAGMQVNVDRLRAIASAEKYLAETFKGLKRIVQIATLGGNRTEVEETSRWIGTFLPDYNVVNCFWAGPGRTKWRGNVVYNHEGMEGLTPAEKEVFEPLVYFRAAFVEKLIKSLETPDNSLYVIKEGVSLRILKPSGRNQGGRSWSNGEFYFGACRHCLRIFLKKDFDACFCSKKCAVYYGRQQAKRLKSET
ncbi:MAG: hypothetical protein CVV42_17285 [Candidatus Riflebacteria bacterium HGW-Riflebacteria-2]|jgi:hypothetical protein|nr:MAG: hypothetical protein CVV42_17285 [Candidatus Riflebacteria bacterium HGW-Riflebacteria-2]